jgi:DNA replication protein DnaC
MDNTLLVTSLLITLLLLALSTYFFFVRPRKSSGPSIFLVGPSGSGKTALWSYVWMTIVKN